MIDRDQIINHLLENLEPLSYIHALWLEGADAADLVDAYSDIDFNIDIDDAREADAIAAVETALAALSPIDYRYILPRHEHPKLRQRIYHLADTSPYLMLDVVWQLHSRPAAESCFVEGNRVEAALVLFDKSNVITHRPYRATDYADRNRALYEEMRYRYAQHVRVRKYILRGQYPEAHAYYMRYVVDPLVALLRVIHTPANTDYGLIHVSHHIPAEDAARLTRFLQVASLSDISSRMNEAPEWFEALCAKAGIPSSPVV